MGLGFWAPGVGVFENWVKDKFWEQIVTNSFGMTTEGTREEKKRTIKVFVSPKIVSN